jgi:uncharacterized protein (DUF58 family)
MATRSRVPFSSTDLARAARILVLRSRREATGLFAGNYVSAFRGSGREFDESRPYVPGDDIRSMDWNATARNQQPFVKRFREERDQTLLFALDVSGSMRFGTTGRSKADTAAHTIALVAAAAARAGDRTGLVTFDSETRAELPAARGVAHTWRLIDTAVASASESDGPTRLAAGLRTLYGSARRRAVILLLSDFRDPELAADGGLRRALAGLARRHDLIAGVLVDPREEEVPAVGTVRLADPEHPSRGLLLDTRSRRARERYRSAFASWRRGLEASLRSSGADLVWLRTDRSPLHALARFFHERAARRVRGAA